MTVEARETGTETLDLLLIEDDPGDADLFRTLVSDDEFELEAVVRWETSLQSGMTSAREERPDLLVLDLSSPDADGLDAVRRVTRDLLDVPLVVLTGRDDPELGPAAVRDGAQDYLHKGEVGPRELAHTLRCALLRSRTGRGIRRREQRFGALLANLPDVTSVVGPDGMVLYESPSVKRVLGYEPEELEGENILEYFHPDDRERVRDGLERLAAASGDEGIGEARIRHADGSWRVLEARGRQHPEETDIGGVIVTSRDVTGRVEQEGQLRESEARHRTLVETMYEAAVILDRDGTITFANAVAEQLLGLHGSELAERAYDEPAWRITAPDGGPFPESELPFRRVMETGEPVRNVEHAIERPDGTRTILSVNAAPMEAGTAGPERVVATMRDVTEQKQLESQLECRALHDPLTGLANRSLLQSRLEQGLARASRRGEPLGLLMLDIDEFRRINDQLGHIAGDRVLTEVARRLEETAGEEDTVVRWGGNEFVVVLPGLAEPEAVTGAWERIRTALRPPIEVEGESVRVELTAGAVVHGEEKHARTVRARNPEDLTRFVSLALNWAKEDTGGFRFYDRVRMGAEEAAPIERESQLRDALERGEILPYYQPIVRLDDRSWESVEALARWEHPDEGVLGPAEFIPLAEKLGLIGLVQEAIVHRGGHDLVAREEATGAGKPPRIRFNISGQQFQDPVLPKEFERVVRKAGARPEQVVVEVTETSLMQVPAAVDALRKAGFEVSIDDFGTGYSTLTYLRDLAVDELKIDMTFVQGIVDNPADAALVDTMVTLGDRLGLRVVAEGVETEEQLQKLRSIGCSYGQGYLFGRPAPAADQTEVLPDP